MAIYPCDSFGLTGRLGLPRNSSIGQAFSGWSYLISTMVSALASKTTLADIAIQFLTASHAEEWTSYGITEQRLSGRFLNVG